jgi:hypothetical protein
MKDRSMKDKHEAFWPIIGSIGISWISLIALLLIWGMVFGNYMRDTPTWRMLAMITLFITWFVILDIVNTATLVYNVVNHYAKRNKKS